MDKGRVVETFDIVMNKRELKLEGELGLLVRPQGFLPGCQDIFYEDLEYVRPIFDKIAVDNGYVPEIIRKINVWCRNCRGYIGYIKMPFIEVKPRDFGNTIAEAEISMETRTFMCDACRYHTTIAIKGQIDTIY